MNIDDLLDRALAGDQQAVQEVVKMQAKGEFDLTPQDFGAPPPNTTTMPGLPSIDIIQGAQYRGPGRGFDRPPDEVSNADRERAKLESDRYDLPASPSVIPFYNVGSNIGNALTSGPRVFGNFYSDVANYQDDDPTTTGFLERVTGFIPQSPVDTALLAGAGLTLADGTKAVRDLRKDYNFSKLFEDATGKVKKGTQALTPEFKQDFDRGPTTGSEASRAYQVPGDGRTKEEVEQGKKPKRGNPRAKFDKKLKKAGLRPIDEILADPKYSGSARNRLLQHAQEVKSKQFKGWDKVTKGSLTGKVASKLNPTIQKEDGKFKLSPGVGNALRAAGLGAGAYGATMGILGIKDAYVPPSEFKAIEEELRRIKEELLPEAEILDLERDIEKINMYARTRPDLSKEELQGIMQDKLSSQKKIEDIKKQFPKAFK